MVDLEFDQLRPIDTAQDGFSISSMGTIIPRRHLCTALLFFLIMSRVYAIYGIVVTVKDEKIRVFDLTLSMNITKYSNRVVIVDLEHEAFSFTSLLAATYFPWDRCVESIHVYRSLKISFIGDLVYANRIWKMTSFTDEVSCRQITLRMGVLERGLTESFQLFMIH